MENTRKPTKAYTDPAEPADLFRALEFAHYAGRFRDKVFVIGFTAETPFANLLLDLKVVTGYGIKVALVLPDPAFQLEALISQSNHRGTRFHLSLLTDVLFDAPGDTVNLDFGRIETVLEEGKTPVIAFQSDAPESPGLSLTFLLAGEIAGRLKADKLFLAGPHLEPLIRALPRSHVLAGELEELRKDLSASAGPGHGAVLDFIHQQLARGIPDIVLIEDKPAHLFREIFTHDGAGILFNQVRSSRVRQAKVGDVTDIGLLLRAEIEEGRILPVDENEIEAAVDTYWVYEIDGLLVGAARLKSCGSHWAELAQFATLPRYRGKGRARELALELEEQAARSGFKWLFALTIDERMGRFFTSLGFREAGRKTLPAEWREHYDLRRPSRAFVKEL